MADSVDLAAPTDVLSIETDRAWLLRQGHSALHGGPGAAALATGDFVEMFTAMDGLPVTVRLIDPPLHEILPPLEDLTARVARAEALGTAARSSLMPPGSAAPATTVSTGPAASRTARHAPPRRPGLEAG